MIWIKFIKNFIKREKLECPTAPRVPLLPSFPYMYNEGNDNVFPYFSMKQWRFNGKKSSISGLYLWATHSKLCEWFTNFFVSFSFCSCHTQSFTFEHLVLFWILILFYCDLRDILWAYKNPLLSSFSDLFIF